MLLKALSPECDWYGRQADGQTTIQTRGEVQYVCMFFPSPSFNVYAMAISVLLVVVERFFLNTRRGSVGG